jgi:hypothetical protein
MKELIEALIIFSKYTNEERIINCEREILYVYIDPNKVEFSTEDINKLEALGFIVGDGCFYSYKYGSN